MAYSLLTQLGRAYIIKYLKRKKKKKNTLQISKFPLVLHENPHIKQGSRTTGNFRSLTLSIYKNVFNLKVKKYSKCLESSVKQY